MQRIYSSHFRQALPSLIGCGNCIENEFFLNSSPAVEKLFSEGKMQMQSFYAFMTKIPILPKMTTKIRQIEGRSTLRMSTKFDETFRLS